jgi:hypothetical protein
MRSTRQNDAPRLDFISVGAHLVSAHSAPTQITGGKAGQQQVSKKEMGPQHREDEHRGDKADRRQVHLAAKTLFGLPKKRERKPVSMLQGAGYCPGAAMSFNQLNPPIPVSIIGNGDGFAVAVIDYGQELNLIWVTAINATAEIWCAPNLRAPVQGNWTLGRDRPASVARQGPPP